VCGSLFTVKSIEEPFNSDSDIDNGGSHFLGVIVEKTIVPIKITAQKVSDRHYRSISEPLGPEMKLTHASKHYSQMLAKYLLTMML
jgi:hypothetical protein